MRLNIEPQRRNTSPLRRLRRTHEGVLLQFEHRLDDIGRPMRETNPPTGHGIRLGKTFDNNRARIELRGRNERAVVTEPTVDFVANERDIVLCRQFGKALYFRLRRHDAGRIRRAVE